MPSEWTVKGILEWLIGNPVGWITGFSGLVAGIKGFGLDKKMGFDIGAMFDTVVDWISNLWDKLVGKAEEAIDPESVTMNKAIIDRINEDSSFPTAEKALRMPSIGKELRDMAIEASKEGGDPIKVGRALHQNIVAHILDKWQDANTDKTPSEELEQLANNVATGITGIADQDRQPRVVRKGIVGLLMQAKEAKDKDSTLTEGEVKAITLSPEIKALADEAAGPARKAAADTEAPPAAPPKDRKPAAPAAGK